MHLRPCLRPVGHLVLQRSRTCHDKRQPGSCTGHVLVPCCHEEPESLLLGQPAQVENVVGPRGPMDVLIDNEVVVHGHPVRRHPGLDEDVTLRTRDAQEPRDARPPQIPVGCLSDDQRKGGRARGAVATVTHRLKGRAPDTIGADPAVAVKRAGRADLSVVVQGCDRGNSDVSAGSDDRRAQQGERAVDVDNVRTPGTEVRSEVGSCLSVPGHPQGHHRLGR